MFIGHYAVSLAAKRAAPRVSLGTLVLSSQFLDLLWPAFLLLGVEHVRIAPGITAFTPLDFYDYPITHSLAGAFSWSLLLGLLYAAFRRNLRGSLVVALCCFSHWFLDFLTHRPDLPVGFGNATLLGLGLWNSVLWTIVVEGSLFVAGGWVYLRTTAAKDRIGTGALWSFIAFLVLIYGVSIFGPVPTEVSSIAIAGNAAWLFVAWAYWIDRHRVVKTQDAKPA
jgi:hypothetical protein